MRTKRMIALVWGYVILLLVVNSLAFFLVNFTNTVVAHRLGYILCVAIFILNVAIFFVSQRNARKEKKKTA